MAGRHGIRLPGILIVPSETEKSLTIFWKQPGGEQLATSLDLKQYEISNTVMDDQQAREIDVLHLSERSEQREPDKTGTIVQSNMPAQETRNARGVFTSNVILSKPSLIASERIHVTARQTYSVPWDLTIDGDNIVFQRLSSVDMAPEVSTQRSLRLTADSSIQVKRYETGMHVSFLQRVSIPRNFPDYHLPGDPTREYIDDVTYYIVQPPRVEREHDDDGTEGENETREDADVQEQSRQDVYYDAKSHLSDLSGESKVSEDPWEVFAKALKRVVEAAGGTFTRLADQHQGLVAQCLANTTWPNSFPKQLVANQRRQGLTTSEYLYHHTIVHGRKSWNAPDTVDQPIAYVQGHIFDSAYGINTTENHAQPSYFGHNDITELYSRSESSFSTPPSNNYTATVIGPDGNAFSDFSGVMSFYAYEAFQDVQNTCGSSDNFETYNAFYWVVANASNANTSSFDNATFAANIMNSLLADIPSGTIYNASTHTPVPGLDSRAYYGGYNNPSLNGVFKFWLCDDNPSVTAFRNAQAKLVAKNKDLGINFDASFVTFSRSFLLYDRSNNIPFDTTRGNYALLADRFRGNVAQPPKI
ncbi:unnamed protein product [Alternaria alternata]